MVICYSWTGNAYALAQTMGQTLGLDVFRLEEKKPRVGKAGFASGGACAALSLKSTVKTLPELDNAETIYLFLPVWASMPPPAINTLLAKCCFTGKRVHVFYTQAGSDGGRFERVMAKRLAKAGAGVASMQQYVLPMGKTLDEEAARELTQAWLRAVGREA